MQLRSGKIIIVGNGSSVLLEENGGLIDSFEEIVRFNKYAINGYEKNVGTKTSIWFTVRPMSFYKKNWRLKIKYSKVYFCYKWDQQAHWYNSYLEHFKNLGVAVDKIKADQISRKINTEFNFSKKIEPSTGLIAILKFIDVYEKVFITGFDWWDNKKNHYYDDAPRASVHSPALEKEIIDILIKKNKIQFI
ncbi:MAG: hypothetical protein FJX80_00460 [Bacteroidetes bacterium]|nr:hypothetical protein [Bacteroidota bacterium]